MKADFIFIFGFDLGFGLGFSVWLNWYWEVRFKSNLSLLLTTCGELMCRYLCETPKAQSLWALRPHLM